MLQERPDIGTEGGDTAIDSAQTLALCYEGEEALDLVESGGARPRRVHVPMRPLAKPVADQRCLMGGVVVHDQMDVEILGYVGFDLVKEPAGLGGAMSGEAFGAHMAVCDIEGCEKRVVPSRFANRPSIAPPKKGVGPQPGRL